MFGLGDRHIDKVVVSRIMSMSSTVSLVFILTGLLVYIVGFLVDSRMHTLAREVILIGLYILFFTPLVSLTILAVLYAKRHSILVFFPLVGIISILTILIILLTFL